MPIKISVFKMQNYHKHTENTWNNSRFVFSVAVAYNQLPNLITDFNENISNPGNLGCTLQ